LGALLKKEERERKVKERGQMSQLKKEKLSPFEHPNFSPKFFQSSKRRGMRSFSREQ
jgi:hypothetical protein